MKRNKKTAVFILCFVILEIAAIMLLQHNLRKKRGQYLQKKTQELQIAYSTIVDGYDIISQTVFNEIINHPGVIDIFKDASEGDSLKQAIVRKNLLNKLNSTYQSLNRTNNIRLHFLTPDCRSFLRFYNPGKYGDNLSKTRYSIKTANEKKANVQGFEIGSSYSGYRYIFPMFSGSRHIGSVEIGISNNDIANRMGKLFHNYFCFIFDKTTVEKTIFSEEKKRFTASPLNSAYLKENDFGALPDNFFRRGVDAMNKLSVSEKNKVNELIKKDSAFAVATGSGDSSNIVSFIPIRNFKGDKTAYIISCSNDGTISEYDNNFVTALLLVSIALVLIMSLIFYIYLTMKTTRDSRDQLQSITDNMTEGLLLLDKKYKIIYVNPAAEKVLELYAHELKGRELANIIYYKNESGLILTPDKWEHFDNVNFGLDCRADKGFFFIKNNVEIQLELTASPRYQKTEMVGFIVVFRLGSK